MASSMCPHTTLPVFLGKLVPGYNTLLFPPESTPGTQPLPTQKLGLPGAPSGGSPGRPPGWPRQGSEFLPAVPSGGTGIIRWIRACNWQMSGFSQEHKIRNWPHLSRVLARIPPVPESNVWSTCTAGSQASRVSHRGCLLPDPHISGGLRRAHHICHQVE